MNKSEFFITPESEKPLLHTAVFSPDDPPVAVLQIVHGMNEHKERYYPFAEFLTQNQIAVIISDTRGHGQSVVQPDDIGYMYEDPAENAVRDVFTVGEHARKIFGDVPLFVMGHSMGSLTVRCFLLSRGNADGIILAGSPCFMRFSGVAGFIESELTKKLGERHRSRRIAEMSESFLNMGFGDSAHSWICSDPEVVLKFNNDPLCSFIYTLNGYEALVTLIKRTYSEELWEKFTPENPDIPVHFISGKDDPCLFSEEKFFDATRFLETRGFRNVTHKLYPGMRHEILNETDKNTVWEDIVSKIRQSRI